MKTIDIGIAKLEVDDAVALERLQKRVAERGRVLMARDLILRVKPRDDQKWKDTVPNREALLGIKRPGAGVAKGGLEPVAAAVGKDLVDEILALAGYVEPPAPEKSAPVAPVTVPEEEAGGGE